MGSYRDADNAGSSSSTVSAAASSSDVLSGVVVEPDTHGEVLDVEETTVDDIVSRGIQRYPPYWRIGVREQHADDTAHVLTVRATDPETGDTDEYELVLGLTDGTLADGHDTQFETINKYLGGKCDDPFDLRGEEIPLRFVAPEGYHVAIDPLDFDRWLLDNGYKHYDDEEGYFRVSSGAWAGDLVSQFISIGIAAGGGIGAWMVFDFITLDTEIGAIISLAVLLAVIGAPIVIHHNIQKHVINHVA
jgi:hypothetical protein